MLKQKTITILRAAVLLAGAVGLAVTPAAAQMQGTFSRNPQQDLNSIVRGFPPSDQPLVLNAIRQLGPQRTQALLAEIRAIPAPTMQAYGRMVLLALQYLPPQDHQRFINGLFQVSPAEHEFTSQIMTQIGQGQIRMNQQSADTFAAGQAAKRRTDDATICALGASSSSCYGWWRRY
jgi:hypothetical protein